MTDSLKKIHEESIESSKKNEQLRMRRDDIHNKNCLPPNCGEFNFRSVIFTIPFNLEEFDKLIEGLNELYMDYSEELDYKDIIKNSEITLSHGEIQYLPYILNTNSDIFTSESIEKNLGNDIKFLRIILHHFLPSMVMVQVHVSLDSNFSEKFNQLFLKHHESEIIYHEFDEDKFQKSHRMKISSKIPANRVKKREINQNITFVKSEIIKFLADYFNTNLLKLALKSPLIIPNVEIYTLNFPEETKELNNWFSENHGFFKCIGANYQKFRDGNYLLLEDDDDSYSNYKIFSKTDSSKTQLHLEDLGFIFLWDMFAVERWLQIQEKIVGKFNFLVSGEFDDDSQLENSIRVREDIYQKIFYFERFKSEFELPNIFKHVQMSFMSIDMDDYDFNSDLSKSLENRIKDIDNLIKTYQKHSNLILNLKNIKYSKEMQDKVELFTYIVIGLAFIQIIVAIIDYFKS